MSCSTSSFVQSGPVAAAPGVRLATGSAERDAIERFRYEIYVAEMGKPLGAADHVGRRLADPADAEAQLLYVPHEGAVVGVMRLHIGNAPLTLLERLQHWRHQADASCLGLVSKTMVAAGRRGTQAFAMLSQHAYRTFFAAGMTHVLLHCRPDLVGLYRRLGFTCSEVMFECPEVGTQIAMVLDLSVAPAILRRDGARTDAA